MPEDKPTTEYLCPMCGRMGIKDKGRRRCIDCRRLYLLAWRRRNRETVNAENRRWHAKHSAARNQAINKWRAANKERCRKYCLEWAKRHPDKAKIKNHARRARLKGKYSEDDIQRLLRIQGGLCANPSCRIDITNCYEIDHVIPISRGGTNTADNIQLLCRPCNCKKQARDPYVWAQENGLLST